MARRNSCLQRIRSNTEAQAQVGRFTKGQHGAGWHGAWALALALAMAALYFGTDAVQGLDRRFYDAATSRASHPPLDEIVVVAIDEPSLEHMGAWPWSRAVYAQLVDRLAAAGAKTIVLTVPLDTAQPDRALPYLQKIRSLLQAAPPEAAALNEQLGRTVAEAEAALDADARLAASMARAGNVLLPTELVAAPGKHAGGGTLPPYVHRSALSDPGGRFAPSARAGAQPLALFGQAAAGIGYVPIGVEGTDRVVREATLLLGLDGAAVPSLAFLTAMHSLHLGAAQSPSLEGGALRLGGLVVPLSGAARMRPHIYTAPQGKPPFPVLSLHSVLSTSLPAAQWQGKIVLVGSTTPRLQPLLGVPGGALLAPVELLAHQVSSIRQGHVYTEPVWGAALMWASLAAMVLWVAAALPRWGLLPGVAASLALAVALLGLEWVWLQQWGQWLHLVFPVLVLLAGLAAHVARLLLQGPVASGQAHQDAQQPDRMMGLALQGQGQLDMAFERLRRVPPSPELQANLVHLAQDFEQKHQYVKARAVYEHILRQDRNHVQARKGRKRARHLADVAANAETANAMEAPTGVLPSLLGRYQIEKELGRGAMGVVYQGRDPKIGRVVAIKTLALSQEFDGAALVDARERFFREAESAGRLQHQNIVTIYDAGDEHGLAWIAMELLKGQDLVGATKPGQLLPISQVVSIVARVADALDYAHQQNVVHRDIKPANIMFDVGADAVKVSDFGIARITDSSKTRTGLVLGTPSFMAPEQLAGNKVDGRCDLYALGVTLFQLLTGSLPLRGDSMSALMHNIAHQPAPDVRTLRPEVPDDLAHVVALALRKDPRERYQTGRQFAVDLRNAENAALHAVGAAPAQPPLVYDARSNQQEHNMAAFQDTSLDIPAARAPVSASEPGAQ